MENNNRKKAEKLAAKITSHRQYFEKTIEHLDWKITFGCASFCISLVLLLVAGIVIINHVDSKSDLKAALSIELLFIFSGAALTSMLIHGYLDDKTTFKKNIVTCNEYRELLMKQNSTEPKLSQLINIRNDVVKMLKSANEYISFSTDHAIDWTFKQY